MEGKARKRGGARFEELTIKLDKKLFRTINAICEGDPKKINRMIRRLIAEGLQGKSLEELLKLAAPTPRKKRSSSVAA